MDNKVRIWAKIRYTCDAEHPDRKYMPDWSENKVYEFEDTYTIDRDRFYGHDDMYAYIRDDLRLVAGGGYDSKHIHNVEFEFN